MTNALTTFDFNQNSIRVVTIEGAPWFVASAVCKALGIWGSAGSAPHLAKLDEAERMRVTASTLNQIVSPSETRQIMNGSGFQNLISESGLYKLVMRSDKREAKAFQDWVTRDVLPAIRKDGMYVMGEEKVSTGDMSLFSQKCCLV